MSASAATAALYWSHSTASVSSSRKAEPKSMWMMVRMETSQALPHVCQSTYMTFVLQPSVVIMTKLVNMPRGTVSKLVWPQSGLEPRAHTMGVAL